jgi:hypothetical protein
MEILKVKSQIADSLGIELDGDMQVTQLSLERSEIYSEFFSVTEAWSVTGTDTQSNQQREVIVEVDQAGEVSVPVVSCQITFEDLGLSDCLEYRFEDDPQWRLGQVSQLALEDFKLKKFKLWEHQIHEPECEAAFRRLLQQGPIRNVFDKFIFPSSDEVAQKYKVVDEHSGKTVDVPHQVSEMRLWNAAARAYASLDCSLAGAPTTDKEAKQYWDKKISELKELRGREYIESLLGNQQ